MNREARGAASILECLTRAGFEAYVVGGAVRDVLMGEEPHDFDIVTSARPEEIEEVIGNAGYSTAGTVGKSFGVMPVVTPLGTYEVATYRKDFYGADSHRPERIEYADSLEEDVLRRDFTVNGMAMNLNGDIIDIPGGRKDIKKKRLRTIGSPDVRFAEDALRMFRACRFVAKLDFLPEKELTEAMPKAFGRVEGLSFERVKTEIERLLCLPKPAKGLDVLVQSGLAERSCMRTIAGVSIPVPILPELEHLVGMPQEKRFHAFDAWYHTLAVVQETRPVLLLRWAALFHDVAKGMPGIRAIIDGRITDRGHDAAGAEIAERVLSRWGYRDEMIRRVSWLVKNHMRFHYFVGTESANAVKWVRKEARSGLFRRQSDLSEAWAQLTELCVADVIGCGRRYGATDGTQAFGECLAAITQDMPIHTRDLHYDERLTTLAGAHTGDVLKNLLSRVGNGSLENTPDVLYAAADTYMMKMRKRTNES